MVKKAVGFFHKIFGEGLVFRDNLRDGVRWGGLASRTKSDDLEKLFAKAKNASPSKI